MLTRQTLPHSLVLATVAGLLLSGCASEQPAPAPVEEDTESIAQVEEPGGQEQETSVAEGPESSPPVNAYSLDDVAAHNTLDDCWIAVDGVVYDVSGFGPSHPGGASRIEQICGTDATEAFRGQHGTSGAPNSTLAGFEIGMLE